MDELKISRKVEAIINESLRTTIAGYKKQSADAASANMHELAIERLHMEQGADMARADLRIAFARNGVRAE